MSDVQMQFELGIDTPPTRTPSPAEVEEAKTKKGGWRMSVLAGWGVPLPATKGWKTRLRIQWEKENPLCAELDKLTKKEALSNKDPADD